MSTRGTIVNLYKETRLDRGYKHCISDIDYFSYNTTLVSTTNQLSYQRLNSGRCRVPVSALSTTPYNEIDYIKIENPQTGSSTPSTIYGFVDSIEYISDNAFEIRYTVDVMTTYVATGYVSFGNTLVLRRNVNTNEDTIGGNILPEPVDIGNLIDTVVSRSYWASTGSFALFTSFDADNPDSTDLVYQNVSAFEINNAGQVFSVSVPMGMHVYRRNAAGMITFFNTYKNKMISGELFGLYYLPEQAYQTTLLVPVPTTIDGYTPKHNKLFTYPYCFAKIVSPTGIEQDFPFEYFSSLNNNSAEFVVYTGNMPLDGIFCIPKNYMGLGIASLTRQMRISNFPMLPLQGSNLNQTLQEISAQTPSYVANVLNHGVSGFIGGTGMLSNTEKSFASAELGAISAGVSTAQTALSQACDGWSAINRASIIPRSLINSFGGSSISQALSGGMEYYAVRSTVRREVAIAIDSFFAMYGYSINRIEAITLSNDMFNHHYIKTNECIVKGSANQHAKQMISEIMDRGVHFWRGEISDFG